MIKWFKNIFSKCIHDYEIIAKVYKTEYVASARYVDKYIVWAKVFKCKTCGKLLIDKNSRVILCDEEESINALRKQGFVHYNKYDGYIQNF